MSDESTFADPPVNEFGCYDCDIIAGESYAMDDFMGLMSIVFLATLVVIALVFIYTRIVSYWRQHSDADPFDE